MERLRSPFVSVEIYPNNLEKEELYTTNWYISGVVIWSHEEHEWQCKEHVKEQVLRWWNGVKTPKPEAPPPPRPFPEVPRAPPPRQVVQKKLITELSTEKRLKREQEIKNERERERNAEANYQERFDGLTKRKLES